MKKQWLLVFICCIYFSISNAQAIIQDQLWSDDQYRIIMYRDSTFMFSKIDEPMKDMIAGKWLFRADTFYLFAADESKLLLFSFFQQDSMHKKITHLDPRIYNSYSGVKIPIFFYLTKTFYDQGNVCKAYSFASCDETKKCYLNINHFDEKGTVIYTLNINLKTNKATYMEYTSTSYSMPRAKIVGHYIKGNPTGTWHYYEWNATGSKLISHQKKKHP